MNRYTSLMMEDAMATPRKDRKDIVRPKTRLGKRHAALLRELNYINRALHLKDDDSHDTTRTITESQRS